ncbi:MAG TPA: ROK family protein [Chthoniobacterales bacterium]|jgi:predicted NBD/HSP70 family sugar kinase
MHLVGIDLGGTKIEGAIVDPTNPSSALFRTRVPTESAGGYDHIIGQVGKLLAELRAHYPGTFPGVIGIGTPGTRDPKSGLQRGSNTQCLNGRPFRDDLQRALGVKIEIANDANCFALAEATMGAARGYETVFGIIMGTGCGGGFVVNGHVLNGCHGIAGEWGQIVIEPDGEMSGYGTRGIIETILCGPALERYYAGVAGEPRPLKEVVARALAGTDPHAIATMTRMTDTFARALAIIIDTFDPHAVVVGGGVGNIDALYSDETRAKISSHIFAPTFEAALLKPTLGDSAGVFGAAMLTA